MKTFKSFSKEFLREDTISFSYDDGGTEQIILISGSSSQIKKVESNLPAGTKIIDNPPDDVMSISASEWLKIK